MAKRSPILGYNHNVRYRGLVFHVQTEDSGLLSPHLFTHLFHGGVIISTRKLVYDSGAAEDAIKSLMQAQHKAVLKDLKKGSFDEKIDQYLAGTPGLLPRGSEEEAAAARDSEPALPAATATPPTGVPKPPVAASASSPAIEPASSRQPTEADISAYAEPKARTKTADRGSAPTAIRTNLPPPPDPEELNVPTLNDGEAANVAAAVAAASATIPNRLPSDEDNATVPVAMPSELSPLEIELELDEPDEPQRARPRDTDVSDIEQPKPRPGESPLPPPPGAVSQPHQRAASSSVGAATLKAPVTRPPSRPAISPPQVVSRPLTSRDSDAVEVYAPPPPSVDPPPGERPGQYSQHKKASQKIPVVGNSTSGPIPAGLGRPGRANSAPPSGPIPKPETKPTVVPRPAPSSGVPMSARDPSSGQPRPRPPTPTRTPAAPQTAPIQSRTASSSGGVVMTRPAVIVGAPARPTQPQRVRKAREDEGRGFGQGLISEKSLDEVILAYLSEDADEK